LKKDAGKIRLIKPCKKEFFFLKFDSMTDEVVSPSDLEPLFLQHLMSQKSRQLVVFPENLSFSSNESVCYAFSPIMSIGPKSFRQILNDGLEKRILDPENTIAFLPAGHTERCRNLFGELPGLQFNNNADEILAKIVVLDKSSAIERIVPELLSVLTVREDSSEENAVCLGWDECGIYSYSLV